MLKKLLLTTLLTLSSFAYEIVIDHSSTPQEMTFIRSLIDSAPKGFVHIKAGSFMMGSNSGGSDEKPRHRVTISRDFYIGKYEVTVGEFRKFINSTDYTTDAQKKGGCYIYDKKWIKKKDAYWDNPYFSQTDKNPVVCVSHNDASAYTKWLSKKTGQTYRLPSEEEWEYVARAGTTTKYSFGDLTNSLGSYAWYSSNSNTKTHKVGEKKPNAWGVYDVHGNVWEWCEDWYANSYENTPRNASVNTSGKREYKVLRGGSWVLDTDFLRSANRSRNYATGANVNVGFRVLRER